ncbi:MAG: hypothetical protein AAGH19_03340 [Pseudomonadota bacterium]
MSPSKALQALFFSFLALTLLPASLQADGAIGEHVNEMSDHLDEYTEEVGWLIAQVEGIVNTYEADGLEAAKPEMVIDHWEAVKFHSAIETNYIPLYASIWQGLFGVRQAIEAEAPIGDVRKELGMLEETLWQSLGAVKVAAKYQDMGLLQEVATREATTPTATLIEVNQRLDRVVAKYAERLPDEAIEIVQDTYLTRFEGVEGALIEQDAELVEDLEIDFNVRLPQAIQNGASLDEVRAVVETMQGKINTARDLLKEAEASRAEVF